MKILFVISLFSSHSSIASAFSRINFFANYFSKRGNKVVVSGVFNPFSDEKAKMHWFNDIRFINVVPFIPKLNGFSFFFNIISLVFLSWIPFLLTRPNVVVISVPPGESALSYFLFAKIFRVKKIIFDYRDEWEDYAIKRSTTSFYRFSYRVVKSFITKCYRKSNAVVTVTERVGTSLKSREINNVFVIPNGADINIFNPISSTEEKIYLRHKFGIKDNAFVLVYSGIIGEYYDLSIVLYALEILLPKIPKLRFVILGGGTDLGRILVLIKQLNLEDVVLHMGEKTNKYDISEILSVADLGVIPYDNNPLWKNSLPAKGFEYLACGLPILATVSEDSELGNLIVENKVGMICSPDNVMAFSKAVHRIYTDTNFVTTAKENSVSLIRNSFDRNKLAGDFLKIIQDSQ